MSISPVIIAGNYAHSRTCAWCGERPAVRFDQEARDAEPSEVALYERSGQTRLVTGASTIYARRGEVRVSRWMPTCGCNDLVVPDPPVKPTPKTRWCAECGDVLEKAGCDRCDECRVTTVITAALRRQVVKMARRRESTGEIARVTGLGATTVKRIRAEAGVSATARDGAIRMHMRRGNDGASQGASCRHCGHNVRALRESGRIVLYEPDSDRRTLHATKCKGARA